MEGLYISYGKFINVLFNFIIIAFSIFLVIKGVNKMSNKFESEKAKKAKKRPKLKQKLLQKLLLPKATKLKF